MTHPTLRLVVGSPDGADPSVELPTSGPSTLHVHLHLGTAPVQLAAPTLSDVVDKTKQSEKGRGRKFLPACSACVLALVSYEVGTHAAGGPASATRQLPAPPRAAFMPPSLGELPPAVRQQLASPPILTPPPGAQATAGAGNPFGLHP